MNGSAPARTTAPREAVSRAGVADKARTILASPMASRVLWRRSATAIGVYTATVLGFLTTVAATGFFQLLLDLTIEEALVKYGFRYAESKSWGRLRRLFEVALAYKVLGGLLAGLALLALATVAGAN